MRERYEEELKKLNASIISMGKMIEIAIEGSVLALMGWDLASCDEIIKNDDAIDEMEKEIEQLCVRLLLQQQPLASDLRMVTAALKMVTDMERIGDHAGDIADLIKQMGNGKTIANSMGKYANAKLEQMCSEIQKMLYNSISAYIDRDVSKAKDVIANDDIVDELYFKLKREFVRQIQIKIENGEEIADFLLIAKYFERIGDHATNIAEWVIYSITGLR
ncbi:phosphate signaling complex protein PhoU [Treponema sp.]|uniref:phosphate signaling complex protein PhoU n=1 Tax=Treponema sp. TaxID=166 RepID=UPI002A81B97A|nr:phosphate signaling complex protein PhoU [Treponema sp.]MDY4132830.1 phosphate signaling complex protein PhoU [Treponema sp.]